MTTSTYLNEAAAIGDQFVAEAVWFHDRCNWPTRAVPYNVAGPQGDAFPELIPLNPSVYSGTAGMALALGRLATFTGDADHRRTALGAARHAVLHAADVNDSSLGALGSQWRNGFYLGTLGIAWVAAELSELLDVDFLRRDAQRLLRHLARKVDEPMDLDVMFGPASGVPTLLDLERRGYEGSADLAVVLGNHLLKAAIDEGDAGLSWGTRFLEGDEHNLTGFSHGTAGVALALAQLWAHTGDEAYREGANGALRYERHHFYADQDNWPNFQTPMGIDGRWPCTVAWCHGAAGIGLSRAELAKVFRDSEFNGELAVAAKTTRAQMVEDLKYPGRDVMICHGVIGNLECLWAMEEALGTSDTVDRVRVIGDELADRYGAARQTEWGRWVNWPTGITVDAYPPLITGVAGVLHFYLRLHAPERVPTVLLPARPMEKAS